MKKLKVLVGCEYSGIIREAFNRLGHDAMSCDLLETEQPGNHYQGDIFDIINDGWDLAIFHPPCTYLTCAAEWAYKDVQTKKIKPGTLIGQERREAREESIRFFDRLLNAPIKHIAVENPVGVISSRIRKPDQTIQPWWFGDDASKKTCLWLKNLPLLVETNRLPGDSKTRRGNQTATGQNKLPPSADRWKERSRTYPGIANAIAYQWSEFILSNALC